MYVGGGGVLVEVGGATMCLVEGEMREGGGGGGVRGSVSRCV